MYHNTLPALFMNGRMLHNCDVLLSFSFSADVTSRDYIRVLYTLVAAGFEWFHLIIDWRSPLSRVYAVVEVW